MLLVTLLRRFYLYLGIVCGKKIKTSECLTMITQIGANWYFEGVNSEQFLIKRNI